MHNIARVWREGACRRTFFEDGLPFDKRVQCWLGILESYYDLTNAEVAGRKIRAIELCECHAGDENERLKDAVPAIVSV